MMYYVLSFASKLFIFSLSKGNTLNLFFITQLSDLIQM